MKFNIISHCINCNNFLNILTCDGLKTKGRFAAAIAHKPQVVVITRSW